MPRSRSSGSRSVSTPVSARTSTVLPWSMWPAVPRVSGCTPGTLAYRERHDTPTRWATGDGCARGPRARLAAARHRLAPRRGAGGRLPGVVAAREARGRGRDGAPRRDRLGHPRRLPDALRPAADRGRVARLRRRVRRAVPVAPAAARAVGPLGVELAQVAHDLRGFGREGVRGDSPLYAHLSEVAADTPALLALAAGSLERSPMLFFAAIHDELLRAPDDELAAYYPTVGGRRAPDDGLGPALVRFCEARAERLEATFATRHTQTNEVARCAALLPAFAAVFDGRPLAQIEIGASAGLNGLWDRYAYDYGGQRAGDPDSPLRIDCELIGPGVPPLEAPQ